MKTVEDVQLYLEEIIEDIYSRPMLYGPDLLEVETRLNMLHLLWAQIAGRREELNAITLQLTPVGFSSCAGSFHRVFDLIHEVHGEKHDHERLEYIVGKWKAISDHMGITSA
jgi:hypothetical protein